MYFLIFIEILVAILIANKRSIFRNILSISYIVIICIQISAIYMSGDYLVPMAFANLDAKVGNAPYIGFGIPFVLCIIFLIIRNLFDNKMISNIAIVALIIFSFCSFSTTNKLINSYLIYKAQNDFAKNTKIFLKNKDLLKDDIVYDSNITNYLTPSKKNMIVFFTEGFSSRIISKELTPNIYNFLNESINVTDYFNHAAATFRGLRGQLTSFYQSTAGWYADKKGIQNFSNNEIRNKFLQNNQLISVTSILKLNNYHTYFYLPHNNNLRKMLVTIGFDKIFTPKHFPNYDDVLHFNNLFNDLSELKEPFFIGVYNLGTHLGIRPPKKFVYKDSEFLDKYHYYDIAFGNFIAKFKKSKYFKDTIIIFTADHAAFGKPKEYRELFNKKDDFFADQIPFAIYFDGVKPVKYSARNLNSLSFAPTICDILGIKKGLNKFLGYSIFDNKKPKFYHYMSNHDEILKIHNNKFELFVPKNKEEEEQMKIFKQFLAIGG